MNSIERQYPDRPIVGVGAVILVDQACRVAGMPASLPRPCGVVLIKRRFAPLAGEWSLPGGVLETGETLETGVAREMLEETGLIVAVGPVIEVFDRIMLDDEQRVRHHYVLIDYLCRPVGGRLEAGSDASGVVIADPRELAPYGMTPKVGTVVSRGLDMREQWAME